MRIHEVIQLAICRIYQRVPLWMDVGKMWLWWTARKCIFYGTCIYIFETVFGHHRRPLGSSTIREGGYTTWLPTVREKEYDETSKIFLRHLGLNIIKKRPNSQNLKFYTDVPYQAPLIPIADDEPFADLEGNLPLGFRAMQKTLRVLGYFPAKYCVKIWKCCDVINLKAGQLAFDFGEVDDFFVIVVSGSLTVSIQDTEFGHVLLNTVTANEHVMSIFALCNYVIGGRVFPRLAQACADEDSIIVKVFSEALKHYFWEDRPHDLIPFAVRMLSKIRSFYFEGLTEVAGLNKQLVLPHFSESSYQPFDNITLCSKGEFFRMIQDARQGLSKYLKLTDEELKQCSLGSVTEGSSITIIGARQENLIYIYKGELALISYSTVESRESFVVKDFGENGKKFARFEDKFSPVFYVGEGSLVGSWSLLTHCKNYYSATLLKGQKAIVLEIPGHIVKKRWEIDPFSVIPIMKGMLGRWSKLALKIDYGVQWSFVAPGHVIYRKGDPKIATFLVLSGRLRYMMYEKRTELEAKSKFGHYETGDWFGFVECVTNSFEMQKTVISDRYSEIVMLSEDIVTLLSQLYPSVVSVMTNYLALRIHKDYQYDDVSPPDFKNKTIDDFTCPKFALEKNTPCSVLAVFPMNSISIPGELYCQEIVRHYPQPAKFLSYESFRVGNNLPDMENVNGLTQWFARFESKTRNEDLGLVVLLADSDEINLWNLFICRQADYIQILVTFQCEVIPSKMEKMIEIEGWKATKSFVFLHPAQLLKDSKRLECQLPRGTFTFLNRRPFLDHHHHVRFPICAFKFMQTLDKSDLDEFEEYKRIIGMDKYSDIARVGRWLSNSMVGIVLGGGGAKGGSHLGIMEFLRQIDLPIDYLCGVSIGAFVGALYAYHNEDMSEVEKVVRHLMNELKKPTKYFLDFTVPYVSMYRGRCFDEFVQNSFSDTRMEDLWIPYFPVTTDITGRHSRAHRHGQMWFYVRGSMTLSGVFPPLVNPEDNHLLMDGGYSEILPGNHLRACGVRFIIASDIGDQNGVPLFNIGYAVSGVKCAWQNSMPLTHWPNVPSRLAFWESLNYISARKYVHLLKRKDKRLIYIRPAVEFYSGRDFRKYEELRLMAYYTTKKRFGSVRAGIPPRIVWNILNTRHRDSDTSDENNIIYQTQAYNYVPDPEPETKRYGIGSGGDH